MTNEPPLKPIIWVGSSRKNLREFPEPVQDHMGYALYVAQRGGDAERIAKERKQ
jgi:phage-related protein